MTVAPLNQSDIYRIVRDFDRVHFKTPELSRDEQIDHVKTINRFERKLEDSHLPIDLVDMIMRRHLEESPSVGALLMFYRNVPSLERDHPLPLARNVHHLNNASEFLLSHLNQQPSEGYLASYRQLMTVVFKHHFSKLSLEQKFELIQRSSITPWEQRSTQQKLSLLGRIQAPTLLGQAKVKLRMLTWKVQFAAVWALEKNLITKTVSVILGGVGITALLLLLGSFSSTIAASAVYLAFLSIAVKAYIYGLIALAAILGTCLVFGVIGFALRAPIFPTSIQEKGFWVQSVSFKCSLLAFLLIIALLPKDTRNGRRDTSVQDLMIESQELQKLLLQSINQANITVDQESFANAQLSELVDKWLILTSPNDKGIGSSQMQQSPASAEMARLGSQ